MELIHAYITRRGGYCGMGTTLLALDSKMDVYPCHRLASIPSRQEFKLGNVFNPTEFSNFHLYNSYFRMGKKFHILYSAVQNITDFSQPSLNWFMWCPATNFQTSDNIYYQNSKYNIMLVELNRYIGYIYKKYQLAKFDQKINPSQCSSPHNV
jgi:hypothetical protein